jgi:1-acyl-sn-glycerol-3-phosphate acyltransferase
MNLIRFLIKINLFFWNLFYRYKINFTNLMKGENIIYVGESNDTL